MCSPVTSLPQFKRGHFRIGQRGHYCLGLTSRLQRLPPGYFLPSISNGSVACLVVHSTASGETALRRLQQGLLCPMPHSATAPSLALVLDANQRSALAATRSLGSRGVALWTSDATDTALAGRSRFSRRYLRSPSPEHAPEPFMDWLVELVAREGITFLLRSEEHTSELQSRGHLVCRLLLEKKKRTTCIQT